MNRNGYLNFILTLLLAAVVFLGIAAVNAIDRLHRTNLRLLEALQKLPAAGDFVPAAAPASLPPAGPPAANAEYFAPDARPGGRLIRAAAVDTGNLNALINGDAYVAEFAALTNAPLAERNYGRPDEFQPMLAESWTISPDRREYRIKLRRGVLWQDFTDPVSGKEWRNREVTAHDFKFYIDVINNPDTDCAPLRSYYSQLESLTVHNDHEFSVRWREPYYGALVFTLGLTPLPRHLYHDYDGPFDGRKFNDDHLRNRMLIGCGPYRFVKWEKDARIIFTAFENYFGARLGIRPPLRDLAYELIKHPNTRYQALLSGGIDRLELTPDQWLDRSETPEFKAAGLKKYQYLSHAYFYIGYNLRNPLFTDKRVRQALTMLIDREKIRETVYRNLAEIATGPFFPKSVYSDPAIKPWPYDPARARRLLAEAGYTDADGDGILEKDGRKFTFTILQPASSTTQEKMLPMIKETLAQAGIDMKIQVVEWSVYLQRLQEKNFEVCCLAWTTPMDPDPFQVWHSSQAELPNSSNHISFRNPEADRLIEALRREFDMPERIRLAREFHRLLHEEQPYTFLFVPYTLTAQSDRYRNVRLFDGGIATDLMWTPPAEQKSVPGM